MKERLRQDEIIMVRMDKAIRAKLEKLAAGWAVTLSAAIRRLIVEAKLPKENS